MLRIPSREDTINTEHAVLEAETITDTVAHRVPRLAEGIELIGEYQGSGFQEPKYILRRADGQVIQLPRLLYLLAATLDGQRDLHQVAAVLSAEFGRIVQAEQVAFLIDNRFQPAGIMAANPTAAQSGTAPKTTRRPDPLLALKLRVGVVAEPTVWRIAGVFQPMFWPSVILAALTGFVTLDVVIIARGGLGRIVPSGLALVYQPALTLLVLAMVLASATFHECGHVSACRYGGARPGVMGFGLYLVWPALYSTVTDSYRLNRVGRLRTDLGGVYFNTVFIAGMNLAYLGTGSPWLLVAIVALHFETAMQFLPMIRLDGYYILSDLIGVPDLFSWMGPVLMSMIPGRAAHSRVRELKPWVRATITLWVLIVVPYLLYWLVGFLIVVPQVLPVVWHQLVWLAHTVGTAVAAGRAAEAALGVVNIILLLLPWVGSLLVLGMLLNSPLRMALARWAPARLRVERSSVVRATAILAAAGLLAGCVGADAASRAGYNGNEDNASSRVLGVNSNGGIGGNGGNGVAGTGTGAGGNGSDATGGDGGIGVTGGNGATGGNGGNGGNGGTGGNGTAGGGGNSVGGNGGNADGGNGGDGVDGVDGVPGVPGGHGADGAPGGDSSDSGAVAGSGHLTSRVIALPGVTSVVVGASFVVQVTMGEPEQATIRIDDNLTDRVDATVTDGTLRLGLKPGGNVRNPTLSAEITVRHLDQLSTSGTSQVTLLSPGTGPALQLVASGASKVAGSLRVDHLKTAQSGASVLVLSGHAGDLHLRAAGTSRLLGPELTVTDLYAQLSGASQATVAVNGTLAATADGVSVLRYHGTPSITRRQTFGASSIGPSRR